MAKNKIVGRKGMDVLPMVKKMTFGIHKPTLSEGAKKVKGIQGLTNRTIKAK